MASTVRRRGTGAVMAGAAACALVLPPAAHAAEDPDPIIAGSCAATLDDEAGSGASPLTADAGAAAETPGIVTVGLGTGSEGTNGHRDPLLTVPVSDTLDEVGATSIPVVSDTAAGACELAKPVVNEAGSAAQNILPIDDVPEPDPGAPAETRPPSDPSGEAASESSHPDGSTASVATGPGFGGFGEFGGFSGFGEFVEAGLPAVLDGGLDALGKITLPPAASIDPPVRAPDLDAATPNADDPDDRAQESGTAQAVPATGTQDRLPLLLAVIALALVAAALSKTIHNRKPA